MTKGDNIIIIITYITVLYYDAMLELRLAPIFNYATVLTLLSSKGLSVLKISLRSLDKAEVLPYKPKKKRNE